MTLLLFCSPHYQGLPNSISDFAYQPSIKLIAQVLFFKRSQDASTAACFYCLVVPVRGQYIMKRFLLPSMMMVLLLAGTECLTGV